MCARQVLYHCMPSLSPWFLKMLVFETGACEITHTGLKLTLFLRQLWNCLGHLCGWVCATRPDPGDLIYGGDRSTRAKIWMDHNPYVNGLSFLRLRIRNDRRGAIEPTASRVLTHLHRSVVPSSVTSQSQRLGQGGKRFYSFVVYCRNPATLHSINLQLLSNSSNVSSPHPWLPLSTKLTLLYHDDHRILIKFLHRSTLTNFESLGKSGLVLPLWRHCLSRWYFLSLWQWINGALCFSWWHLGRQHSTSTKEKMLSQERE